MFNRDKFADLLKEAIDKDTIQDFANKPLIDRSYLSKFINKRLDSPPSPDILMKIAKASGNRITYEQLMDVSGYFNRRFVGENLALLRGDKTHEQYADYLEKQGGVRVDPLLLERYEKGLEYPHEITVKYLADTEGIEEKWFYETNNEVSLQIARSNLSIKRDTLDFMNKEIRNWVMNPENYPYIEFIYNSYKSGMRINKQEP